MRSSHFTCVQEISPDSLIASLRAVVEDCNRAAKGSKLLQHVALEFMTVVSADIPHI
jgi:acetaldehyde dehydrogenase (acetylating)